MPDIREYREAATDSSGRDVELPLEPALRARTLAVGASLTLLKDTTVVLVVPLDGESFRYDVNVAATVDPATRGTSAGTSSFFFGKKRVPGLVFETVAIS